MKANFNGVGQVDGSSGRATATDNRPVTRELTPDERREFGIPNGVLQPRPSRWSHPDVLAIAEVAEMLSIGQARIYEPSEPTNIETMKSRTRMGFELAGKPWPYIVPRRNGRVMLYAALSNEVSLSRYPKQPHLK